MKKFWLGFVVGIASTIVGGAMLLGAAVLLIDFYAQRSTSSQLSAPDLHRMGGQPRFSYKTLDGETRQFADLRGKVVVVSVWETWCGPCKAELPSIQKLYEAYKNDQDVVILVIADDTPEEIRSTAKSIPIDLPLYTVEEDDLPKNMAVESYPTTYVIARDGTVAAIHNGAADWSAESVKAFVNDLKNEHPDSLVRQVSGVEGGITPQSGE